MFNIIAGFFVSSFFVQSGRPAELFAPYSSISFFFQVFQRSFFWEVFFPLVR